jgi:hypothetical protein
MYFRKHIIARYEERERLLTLKHETELVEAEKKGKEEALRQFNTLAKEVSILRNASLPNTQNPSTARDNLPAAR